MADDPEDDLPLDPPEDGDDQEQEQEITPEEQEPEPEGAEVDAQPEQRDRQDEQRQPSRGERRFQTLSRELSEQRQRNEELNRRLDSLIAGQPRPQQGESPEARAARQALLTPEERIREELQAAQQVHSRDMQTLQFSILDGNDRAAFEAKATVDPLFSKWKPKVEAELAALRSKGQSVEREKLMFYLIGKNAVETRKQSSGQQRHAAQGRVRQQSTRPSNSGSDTSGSRRDRNTSLERRLENQSI